MILYPAIDLKDGECVRLLRGDMDVATVFNDDPAAQAKAFADEGAEWLHVVDLNGAFEGKPVNADAVDGILKASSMPVQLGGGIRSVAQAVDWVERGLSRVILGTVAIKDPSVVIEACKELPGKVAVGIDARDGFVAVEGWAEVTEITALNLAKKFEDAGVAAIIYTDIERDGAMQGPNTEATSKLADHVSIPIIASGGVSNLDDLSALKAAGNISGVISGRALYDGRIDIASALKLLKD
ncbi:1-(5-phosphoribosyl)-5-[(5-phosphoribosylamino)methylideneamino]imidazole-4-carboxamide isomerase [Curvivirga aplysinae]|uniref:1-(5-phosphoribosyl)-5-[(5- phosphoribosylamino)methylideneamino]imidazole-4- carboxamide isomerase n=1 Tax=Curvivirga aplysinae TaxID=2529852 RepID=UPI0012BCDCCC|nr:1-(5-phosphoribosyl)-5-[(5-phosphoribosylamino)methylideneamino]imidazole-4-carboxamide isomerase [Curvivirga aplysinae]MTI08600.1 1-(5-phosphoribosyl)-5-[(5-phosphoribosylamino)methylideneamino]imidazole-4-carboxamide isomerase [Curvivirga aplysinae]